MKTESAKTRNTVARIVTDKIVEALRAGTMPWRKEYGATKARYGTSMPHNAATGRAYSGINVFLLSMAGLAFDNDPRWITYNQAKAAGGNVKAGEKSPCIVTYMGQATKEQDNGTDKTFRFLKFFSVFHVSQCENLDPAKLSKLLPESERKLPENAAELIDALGARVLHGHAMPCYSPALDHIEMPDAESFTSEAAHFATLTHELTHWTGAGHRCKRDQSGRFGSKEYAFEELVAELGSAILCAEYGIDNVDSRSAAYIGSWLEKLEKDEKFIFDAMRLAKKALDFMGETAIAKSARDDAAMMLR